MNGENTSLTFTIVAPGGNGLITTQFDIKLFVIYKEYDGHYGYQKEKAYSSYTHIPIYDEVCNTWLSLANQYFLKGTSMGRANFNSLKEGLGYLDISSYFNIFLWLLLKIYVIFPVRRFSLSFFDSTGAPSFYLEAGPYSYIFFALFYAFNFVSTFSSLRSSLAFPNPFYFYSPVVIALLSCIFFPLTWL